MICGLGMDIVEMDRIRRSLERFGDHFLRKILTRNEVSAIKGRGASLAPALAARFAAKEAAVKALGTGFTQGIWFHHIEVSTLPSGQPTILWHGPAAERMTALGAVRSHVTLTHGRDVAAAVVVLETA